jgi:NAD(P)-dependent dehydrogenase (short-subunit alcohol dehydrogenase family)
MSTDKSNLKGRLALVTGAGTGIGHGVALELGRRGVDVVLHFASSGRGAMEAAEQIRAMGCRATAIQGDLSQVSECRRIVDEAVAFLGGLDALVNNAGICSTTSFVDTTEEFYNRTFDINMRGHFFCAQQAVPHLLRRREHWEQNHPDAPWPGGSIINMSSCQAFGGVPKHSAYASTKGAIAAFTQVIAMELCPLHIRVNAVAPGAVEVPRYAESIPGYTREVGNTMAPWGRVGLPEDIGHMVAYLMSDAAEWITGQVCRIDGGLTAKLAIDVQYGDKDYQ